MGCRRMGSGAHTQLRGLVAKTKRNIGQEILDGICQIKREEIGRLVNVRLVSSVREKRQSRTPRRSKRRSARSKTVT